MEAANNCAVCLQDPACITYSQALLYYKGYHAIQTHRIAHALWSRGQKVMAVALQSRMSEVSGAAAAAAAAAAATPAGVDPVVHQLVNS
jgi:serine O-acetyltransferase